jgi:hypothetical protein
MDPHEKTPLEQAWLHIIDGEAQVMLQAARIGELVALHQDTTEARAVYAVIEAELDVLHRTLEQERAKAVRRQR